MTNSMGRLTLNILLSFARSGREVIGERINPSHVSRVRLTLLASEIIEAAMGEMGVGGTMLDKLMLPFPDRLGSAGG